MSVSSKYGVPLHLETTYDILGFPKYELSTYASVFHLLAMKATAVLARHPSVNDEAFAVTCDAAFVRAQAAIDQLQWVPASPGGSGGHYAAGSSGCTANVNCTAQEGVFADAFYAQVLAYSVGLDDLLARPERLDTHLTTVNATNCVHNEPGSNQLGSQCSLAAKVGATAAVFTFLPLSLSYTPFFSPSLLSVQGQCPNGLVIFTGRAVQQTDLQVCLLMHASSYQ
jgi:hypothetical protein